ncbi:hypothetical protein TNCV_4557841 [Trichonephila clavipes]|nr:hypothetical protein TNCV_4557841 [Trichonephila clavipes]
MNWLPNFLNIHETNQRRNGRSIWARLKIGFWTPRHILRIVIGVNQALGLIVSCLLHCGNARYAPDAYVRSNLWLDNAYNFMIENLSQSSGASGSLVEKVTES